MRCDRKAELPFIINLESIFTSFSKFATLILFILKSQNAGILLAITMPTIDEKQPLADNTTADTKAELFTDETVQALHEFGAVLQRIHNRLVSEGIGIELDSHYAKGNRTK